MNAPKLAYRLATCLLVLTWASTACAEDYLPAAAFDTDGQYFAPVDLDFEGLPIQRRGGYFFHFDKVNWGYTGERVEVGNNGTSDGSLAPFRQFLTGRFIADGTAVPVVLATPEFLSGIQTGPPRTAFAGGERYELGYSDGETGWSLGILDGPEASDDRTFGLETQDELYGSVLVVFDDPQNLMIGFIDVLDPSGGAFQPDGQADDIDADGQFGPDGYDLEDPGRDPDSFLIGDLRGDFDDLVTLPTSFQFLRVRNQTETDGVELMRTHSLNNLHMMSKHQNNSFELSYGVRYFQLNDKFVVNGTGGVMGNSSWDTLIENNMVGPQVGLKLISQQGRFRFDIGTRTLLSYNIQNLKQDVALGQDLIPSQLNRSLFYGPTVATHGKEETEFSPVAEWRIEGAYQLTGALALRLGYTGFYVNNIRRASQQVKYELPRMGFRDDIGTQHIFINGINVGFEAVY